MSIEVKLGLFEIWVENKKYIYGLKFLDDKSIAERDLNQICPWQTFRADSARKNRIPPSLPSFIAELQRHLRRFIKTPWRRLLRGLSQ